MKSIMRVPRTAASEVSSDNFVKACITFQQAKAFLSQHMNGADVAKLDTVSLAIYNLANKAVTRSMKSAGIRAVKSGERKPLYEIITQVMKNRSSFDTETVMEALKRRGMMPKAEDPRSYITNTLSTRKDLFKRISRGQYKVKPARKLVYVKKPAKQLPAATV